MKPSNLFFWKMLRNKYLISISLVLLIIDTAIVLAVKMAAKVAKSFQN